jgi:saccharopine dehydrogenase-like NADP-dependent oxidoreductase
MIALVGCSVVPGLTSLLTRFAQRAVMRVVQTKICISPGTQHPRGAASFACLLSTVGQKFTAPTNGKEEPIIGWSEPERVSFPPPMGERTAYRVVDIADHFTQPRYFGTETVQFRIGSELPILNLLLSFVRHAQVLRIPLTVLIPISRAFICVAASLGSTAGGVMVEAAGLAGTEHRKQTWCVYAIDGGERIPSLIPAIAAKMVIQGQINADGLIPLPDWISQNQLIAELTQRGIQVAVREQFGEWSVVSGAATMSS